MAQGRQAGFPDSRTNRTAHCEHKKPKLGAFKFSERFQEIHLGHLIFLKPGEKRFLSEELIKATTYVASGGEIIEKLKAMEEAGVTSVVFRVTGTDGRELISEMGREIIAKY